MNPQRITCALIGSFHYARGHAASPSAPVTSGWLPPQRLFRQVFNNRQLYPQQLEALAQVGFDDPLKITPESEHFVHDLFERHQPGSQLGQAIILLRSIISPAKHFNFDGQEYHGLPESDGGLEIVYDHDPTASVRQLNNFLSPTILLKNHIKQGQCFEMSLLLAVLLRSAGINANLTFVPRHAYITAIIQGEKYRLDPAMTIFKQLSTKAARSSKDYRTVIEYLEAKARVGIINETSFYGKREGIHPFEEWYSILTLQSCIFQDVALKCLDTILELAPKNLYAWLTKGQLLLRQSFDNVTGTTELGLEAFEAALSIDPRSVEARRGKEQLMKKLEWRQFMQKHGIK